MCCYREQLEDLAPTSEHAQPTRRWWFAYKELWAATLVTAIGTALARQTPWSSGAGAGLLVVTVVAAVLVVSVEAVREALSGRAGSE